MKRFFLKPANDFNYYGIGTIVAACPS